VLCAALQAHNRNWQIHNTQPSLANGTRSTPPHTHTTAERILFDHALALQAHRGLKQQLAAAEAAAVEQRREAERLSEAEGKTVRVGGLWLLSFFRERRATCILHCCMPHTRNPCSALNPCILPPPPHNHHRHHRHHHRTPAVNAAGGPDGSRAGRQCGALPGGPRGRPAIRAVRAALGARWGPAGCRRAGGARGGAEGAGGG